MSSYGYPAFYVQRCGDHFVVRQRSGKKPLGPSDPIVRRFDEREDAHHYAATMNAVEERIQQ